MTALAAPRLRFALVVTVLALALLGPVFLYPLSRISPRAF